MIVERGKSGGPGWNLLFRLMKLPAQFWHVNAITVNPTSNYRLFPFFLFLFYLFSESSLLGQIRFIRFIRFISWNAVGFICSSKIGERRVLSKTQTHLFQCKFNWMNLTSTAWLVYQKAILLTFVSDELQVSLQFFFILERSLAINK